MSSILDVLGVPKIELVGIPLCMLSVTVPVVTPAAGRRWWLTDGPSGMVWRRRMRPRRFGRRRVLERVLEKQITHTVRKLRVRR